MGPTDLSQATLWTDLCLHPHLPGPHIPEPHICCLKADGEVREAGRGLTYHPEQGPVSIPSCLLGPLFLLGGKMVGSPLLLVEPPPAALASGTAASGSSCRCPSHTPRCSLTFHFLLQLCHQAEQTIYLVAPNTALVSAVLQYERQAQALPAARDPDSHVVV